MSINLLPPSQKEEIKNERLRKKTDKILVVLGLNLCLFTAMIFGLTSYISSKNATADKEVDFLDRKLKGPQLEDLKKQIDSANQNLNKISSVKKEQVSSVAVLKKLTSLLPAKSYLRYFSFLSSSKSLENTVNVENEGSAKIFFAKVSIGGTALNRETLFLFKKSLDQEKSFQGVYFDPSSWTKPDNPDFVVSFDYSPLLDK